MISSMAVGGSQWAVPSWRLAAIDSAHESDLESNHDTALRAESARQRRGRGDEGRERDRARSAQALRRCARGSLPARHLRSGAGPLRQRDGAGGERERDRRAAGGGGGFAAIQRELTVTVL